MIQEELGRPVHEVFSELTPEPVAAASLGQVYRGRLRSTGEEVAVKVQRPGIGENIAIDMVLLRRLVAVVDDNIPQVGGVGRRGAGREGVCCGGVCMHVVVYSNILQLGGGEREREKREGEGRRERACLSVAVWRGDRG